MKHAFLIGILSVILVVLIYRTTGSIIQNQYDDSYLTHRYSINLAEGNGLVYNTDGERIDSASSFLFTVILAGAYKIGFTNLEIVSGIINLLSLFAIAFFVYLSALRLTGKIWIAYLFALIASLHGLVSGWACAGMDTGFFTALLVAFIYFTLIYQQDTISLIILIALTLTRPEGILLLPVWFFACHKNTPFFVTKLSIILAIITLFYGFKHFYYGSIFPNSLTCKLSDVYYASDWKYILVMWSKFAIVPVILSVVSIFFTPKLRLLWLFILPSALACMFIHSDFLRYTSHLYPLFVISCAPLFRRLI
jgi:hypothetical protein